MKDYQITVLESPHFKLKLTNIHNKSERPIILKIYPEGNRALIYDNIKQIVEDSLCYNNHFPFEISPNLIYFCGKMIQRWIKGNTTKPTKIRRRRFIFDFECDNQEDIVLLTT